MIATGLINMTMPVIRYAVGDAIELNPPRGNGAKIITQVEGRVDDVIYTRDGTPVGRLDPVFKGAGAINAAQVIQGESGDIEIRLVPGKGYRDVDGENLVNEFRKRVGQNIDIRLDLCEAIEKQANGKFRAVISHFRPDGEHIR